MIDQSDLQLDAVLQQGLIIRRKAMRYYLAGILLALMLISGGTAFVLFVRSEIKQHFQLEKRKLLASKAAGQLPLEWQGVDIENLEVTQLEMRVPERLHFRLDLADFLSSFKYILIPLVVCLFLGIAYFLNRWT